MVLPPACGSGEIALFGVLAPDSAGEDFLRGGMLLRFEVGVGFFLTLEIPLVRIDLFPLVERMEGVLIDEVRSVSSMDDIEAWQVFDLQSVAVPVAPNPMEFSPVFGDQSETQCVSKDKGLLV